MSDRILLIPPRADELMLSRERQVSTALENENILAYFPS